MDFNSALQKLASYRPRKNPIYRQILADGLPVLERNAWNKQDDGIHKLVSVTTQDVTWLPRLGVSGELSIGCYGR